MKLDRKEFLKKAGFGAVALGALPPLAHILTSPAWADDQMGVIFQCNSVAGPPGTPAAPRHTFGMGGHAIFSPSRLGSQVVGGGNFTHWLFPGANPPAGGTPLPLVGSGTWKPRLLVSYKQLGTYGMWVSGVLEAVVDLSQEVPTRTEIRGARLKVVCNLGAAGLMTPGEAEGITLSIPGTEFSAGGNPGPFVPMAPPSGASGVTVFTAKPIP